jgi:hypothetical protein
MADKDAAHSFETAFALRPCGFLFSNTGWAGKIDDFLQSLRLAILYLETVASLIFTEIECRLYPPVQLRETTITGLRSPTSIAETDSHQLQRRGNLRTARDAIRHGLSSWIPQ